MQSCPLVSLARLHPSPPPSPSQATMLDINLFRTDKGGNPDLIRESQRSRFASVELVDEVIALDKAWRESKCPLSSLPCPRLLPHRLV